MQARIRSAIYTRKYLLITLFLIGTISATWFLTSRLYPTYAVTKKPIHWSLIFSDEFNGNSLDTSKWNAEKVPSPRNHELEYYVPDDISVSNGSLVLKSEQRDYDGLHYTSGAVDSFGKFSFTYGRVDIRAREPVNGKGIWPALWLLGTGCNPVGAGPCPWPGPGANEIDILEQVNNPMITYFTPHYGPAPDQDIGPGSCETNQGDVSADYHVYSLLWEPGGKLTWYVDGTQVCQRVAAGYFKGPMYFIFNTAIGGDWPGSPDDSTQFPQYHSIDYVRVYQNT